MGSLLLTDEPFLNLPSLKADTNRCAMNITSGLTFNQSSNRAIEPLRSVEIHGLRGFSHNRVFPVASPNGAYGSGLTTITGPNNSGKSTIIEALKSYNFRMAPPSFHQGMRNRSTDSVHIKYNYDTYSHEIQSIRPGTSEVSTNFAAGERVVYLVPSRRHFSPYFQRQNQIWGRREYLMFTGDHTQAQRGPSISMFEMRLFDIDRNPEKRKAFNELINQVIPDGINWSIDQSETSQYVLRFADAGKAHSAEGVGEGITSIFAIVAGLYDSSPGDLIVIDEPELSLHPSYQKRLIKLLCSQASDKQIIISTHSPYLIDVTAIHNGAGLCRVWERGSGGEICPIDQDGRDALKKLTELNHNNPHQFGLNAREVFFLDDGIIVAEGQEDVILLPIAFAECGIDIDATFYGWGAGGAENIKFVCALLRSLGYRKVAGILDNDKVEVVQKLKLEFINYLFGTIPAADVRDKSYRRAVSAKDGLLDRDSKVKPHLLAATSELGIEMNQYLENRS